jgi:hypothetical protein
MTPTSAIGGDGAQAAIFFQFQCFTIVATAQKIRFNQVVRKFVVHGEN